MENSPGEQPLRPPQARPKRGQPPPHPPSTRPGQPQGFSRAAPRPCFPGKSGIANSGSHGPPWRLPTGTGAESRCRPGRRVPSRAGSGQAQAGECQDTGGSRQSGGACACPPPGTQLPSAGDRPAARRGGEARTGPCHRSWAPFLRGAPAACRPPGPGERRGAAAAALTSVRREQAGTAPQSPQQAARSSQGRHKGCHLPGAAAARARGALGNGVLGAVGSAGPAWVTESRVD